ncbi:hypothetical protein MKW98_024787 [Papaver atlanticum]|uniref:Uncharacterized protein n=1 Tax=Papaver atlanticum TaxID=357466 RepID=A0AAD4T499_9MAGN|nr:hypothetical protein MKW98_024787 [Papaver atlanticum]
MECLRLLSSSENINSNDECFGRESMQSEQMLEADCREISKNVQDGHWSQLNKRKVDEEFGDAGPIACGDDFPIISRMEVHEEFEDAGPASNRSEGNKSIVLAPFSGERVIVQALMATLNCPWRNAAKRFVKPQELMVAPNSTQRRQAKQVVKSEGEKSIVLASSERIIVQALMAAPYCPWRSQSKRFVKSQGLMAAPNDPLRGQEKQPVKFRGEEKSIVLAPSFSERVIVQGLMAAPNCPWRQAKRDSKSTAHGITKSKVSKEAISLYFRE